MSKEIISVTLMVINPNKVLEAPNGDCILPRPERLVDVQLDGNWLAMAIKNQRECMVTGEPYVIRLFDEDRPEDPVFASAILSERAIFSAFVTGGEN